MLNTKDMTAGSGKARPVINPGNQVIKINKITYDQTPYDKEAYNIVLHVESEPLSGEFEGFLVDPDDKAGPRYKGQVGRVRISPYPFKDTTLPSGREIKLENEVLKSMITLAEALDKRDDLDSIEADNVEQFMDSANQLLSGDTFINACVGSREWENKEGYTNNDLYLPRNSKDGVALENLDMGENSRLYVFSKKDHVREVQKKSSETTKGFEPSSKSGDDFDL
tara:strand:+ start:789 stop:1460 length:672 start_codon:yes stop_codon:yes gene_type:complete